jgi:hypothetical protein
MGQVSASSTVLIDAEPEPVLAAAADYQAVRPKILSPHYRHYRVLEGRAGCRHRGDVETAGHELVGARRQGERRRGRAHLLEGDANLTMVTNRSVAPAGPGSSVTVKTSWQGAGGIGRFFDKTFAPLGLRKIQGVVLANLTKQVEGR